jgi:hypothetical protein
MKKTINRKKRITSMEDSDTIQVLQHRIDMLEMKIKELSIKEERPTKTDLRDIQQARKDIAAGKVAPWSKVKERHG